MHTLQTKRLTLRQWRDEDYPAFASLNSDADVMRFFPNRLSREQSDAMLNRLRGNIERNGWGFWAAEHRDSGQLMGFVGLNTPTAQLPFNPCVEIGWRLAKAFWRQGFASEAAALSLRYGFEQLELDSIVAFSPVANIGSQAVMKKIGMHNTGEDFAHPAVTADSGLQSHVLYRIHQHQWRQADRLIY